MEIVKPLPQISKSPRLLTVEDFHQLRQKGLEYIEQMGSQSWTDYNTHDPGITILEALCYAITDLSYRTGWDMKDLLARKPNGEAADGHTFFTARNILTNAPLTISDYRRVLIDLDAIRNAWLICKDCPCETNLYAHCGESALQFTPPPAPAISHHVTVKGNYDTLLELEQDDQLGDLNNRKVVFPFHFAFQPLGQPLRLEKIGIEARFPEWSSTQQELFYTRDEHGVIQTRWKVNEITAVRLIALDIYKEVLQVITDVDLQRKWNDVFYLTADVEFGSGPDKKVIQFQNVALRFFGSEEARRIIHTGDIEVELIKHHPESLFGLYFLKEEKVLTVVEEARLALMQYRNLCEDFCHIGRVGVEDIAVCADIELKPDADIESVLAQILYTIDTYFNPEIPFYSLAEMQERGFKSEDIFQGPKLVHGFVTQQSIEAANLRTAVRTSDIINLLMDIDGVNAVKNLLLTKYDEEGKLVKGHADHGNNPNQISAKWSMRIADRCQPRLYAALSKFLFFKQDLPFLARPDEVEDIQAMLRGRNYRPKWKEAALDIEIPKGSPRSIAAYESVCHLLPQTYGVGTSGLPDYVSTERRVKAKQLKGYLIFYDQLLSNYLAQLANIDHLFSIDGTVDRTYFIQDLRSHTWLADAEEIISIAGNETQVHKLIETDELRYDRRNRFLDHLMARFGESFADYTLAMHAWDTSLSHAPAELIEDKIRFLAAVPEISRDRFKSFNYRIPLTGGNYPILRKRLARLMGFDQGMEEKILLIEHNLFRPKFYGDALMPVCLTQGCQGCGEEDIYSFQMTCVLPGWLAPFDTNLEMRKYADRTIRSEAPAHILIKTCWVGNDGYTFDPCHPSTTALAELLQNEGVTLTGDKPSFKQACACAGRLIKLYDIHYQPWIQPRLKEMQKPEEVKTLLLNLFQQNVFDATLENESACDIQLLPLKVKIEKFMVAHFASITMNGFQYDKFYTTYEKWVDANRIMDWSAHRMQEKLKALIYKLKLGCTPSAGYEDCECEVLQHFGQTYYLFQQTKLSDGTLTSLLPDEIKSELSEIFDLAFPTGINCLALNQSHPSLAVIKSFFQEQYLHVYTVQLQLHQVLHLFSKLTSVYPPATLHDCDDGSDINPVRLGSANLGGV